MVPKDIPLTLEIILRDSLSDILRSRANAPHFNGCDTGADQSDP